MHTYFKLRVYHQAVAFGTDAMAFADSLPSKCRFGIGQQLQRSSTSVASNIAEGAGRGGPRDFARFLRIAIGSVSEADSQLDQCEAASLGDPEEVARLRREANSIRRQLYALERRVKSR